MNKSIKSKIIGYSCKNKLLLIFFTISTCFFLWQHTTGISWDFSSYLLNAKYLFSNSQYFEWYRPPLMSFLLGILSIFGWKVSEYLFIILVSFIYLLACTKFSEEFNINNKIFYLISLTPFFFVYSFSVGTELLSLSLLILSFAYYKKNGSGFFLGLAFLSRYTNIIFAPILLFSKDIKKILLNCGFLVLTILPWLVINYLLTGNPITSIMDGYASQIKFRGYIDSPFSFYHIILAINILIPLFIGGVFLKIKEIKSISLKNKNFIQTALMLSFFFLIIYQYMDIPFKTERYLFNLILPVAYFSTVFISKINKKLIFLFLTLSMVTLFLIGIFSFGSLSLDEGDTYLRFLEDNEEIIGDCTLSSNAWVYFNYFGKPSVSLPDKRILQTRINQGYRVVIFKHIQNPNYIFNSSFINKFPLIKETDTYLVLGNNEICNVSTRYDATYLENINELYLLAFNETFSITPYELFLTDKIA